MSGFDFESFYKNYMRRITTYLSVIIPMFFVSIFPALAQISSTVKGGLDATATASGYKSGTSTPPGLEVIAGRIITVVIGLTGLIFIVITVYAGTLYLTAFGDETKIKKAKGMLIQGVIGIVIIIAAYAISSFVLTQLNVATTG